MLWFLDLAARAGFVVDDYEDAAEGAMGRDAAGREVVATVRLRPRTRFAGDRRPDAAALAALHHAAHEACFLANSVRSEIRCEPVLVD
jgi:organic hydroperoxide reductase OsmC/OhrA